MEKGNVGSEQLLDGRDGRDHHGATGGDPASPDSRPSVLSDDTSVSTGAELPVSVNLETVDMPFQQPDPQTIPTEPEARDWRNAVVEVGRWPLAGLAVAAVLVAVFALFIARSGQSLRGDVESAEPSAADLASAAATVADKQQPAPQRAEAEPEPPTAATDSDSSSGRSTGTLGPGEGSEFFSGLVVEPDRSLIGTDVDWTPTTVTRPTTVTTATTTPSTEAPSTTAPPETTEETETTETSQSTSTTAASTTTEVPEGNRVRAVSPGSGSEQNPVVVNGGRVTLQAEGSGSGFMRYRFIVSAKSDDGGWRRIGRSRWRSRPTWTINVDRYEGQTIRWTVIGVTGFRNLTEESPPLYIRVDDGNVSDDSDNESDDDESDDD